MGFEKGQGSLEKNSAKSDLERLASERLSNLPQQEWNALLDSIITVIGSAWAERDIAEAERQKKQK